MNYHEGLPELFNRMACAAVNWEIVENPSNHATMVAKEMRELFDAHTAPQIDRHLAAAAEVITALHENLKIERQQIKQAWDALDLEPYERETAECLSEAVRMIRGRVEEAADSGTTYKLRRELATVRYYMNHDNEAEADAAMARGEFIEPMRLAPAADIVPNSDDIPEGVGAELFQTDYSRTLPQGAGAALDLKPDENSTIEIGNTALQIGIKALEEIKSTAGWRTGPVGRMIEIISRLAREALDAIRAKGDDR